MNAVLPRYVLFSQVNRAFGPGRWQFALCRADGLEKLEASDIEPEARGERLDLLTVVRALEALDQPSRVTLVGCSLYVRRGMQYGLEEWRGNGWRWEFFGQMVPVKNGDLWQRMERALRFHRVDCRSEWYDPPDQAIADPMRRRRASRSWRVLTLCPRVGQRLARRSECELGLR
jgi:ribonuclease HI